MHRRNFFKWTGLGALGLALYGCGRNNKTLSQNRYYSGPTTDHFDGTYFYNSKDQVTAPMSDLLKWKLFGNRAKWPEHFVSPYSTNVPETSLPAKTLRVTMIGHASLLIQMHGLNILTDPVYSKRVSPLQYIGPWRHNPPGVAFEALPKIDVVLVTHNHYDHLDIATLARLIARDNPRFTPRWATTRIFTKPSKQQTFKLATGAMSLPTKVGVKFTLSPASTGRPAAQTIAGWHCGRLLSSKAHITKSIISEIPDLAPAIITAKWLPNMTGLIWQSYQSAHMSHAGSWKKPTKIPPKQSSDCNYARPDMGWAITGALFS